LIRFAAIVVLDPVKAFRLLMTFRAHRRSVAGNGPYRTTGIGLAKR
jgi:hypothetical protein